MDARAVEQAKTRLIKAEKASEAVLSATNLEDSEEAWTDYLIAVSAIYSKLEQGVKNDPKSRQWFGGKKKERRDDPLLRYLHAARNSNEHGIERVVEASGPSVDPFGYPRQLNVNERVPVRIQQLNKETLEPEPSGIDAEVIAHGPTLRPIRAHDTRFNSYCDPPLEHLGQPIEFASFAASLCAAALPYLRAFVSDAGALVP
jgi:hypothetical protein